MAQTLINGINYAWSDLVVNIMGSPVAGITSISYKKSRKIENNYGAGSMPVSRAFGNVEFECKIKLYLDEVQVLKALIPTGDLQDIPEFDIVVSFVNTSNLPVQHTIRKCRFMSNGVDLSQGDTKVEIELEILPADIEFA